MQDIRQSVGKFAAQLKREFAGELAQDPHSFRRKAVQSLNDLLSPGPGRPKTPNVTLATELHAMGKSWQEIYPRCISGYASLSIDSQRVSAENLRSAVRARRNAKKRRNTIAISTPNLPTKIVSFEP